MNKGFIMKALSKAQDKSEDSCEGYFASHRIAVYTNNHGRYVLKMKNKVGGYSHCMVLTRQELVRLRDFMTELGGTMLGSIL